MPSLDRGEPAGTLQTLVQLMRLEAKSDRSATNISVQPAGHRPGRAQDRSSVCYGRNMGGSHSSSGRL